MIGFLQGTPKIIDNQLLVQVHGVGYLVQTTPQILQSASSQETIELFIYTHVKEDALDLYGFNSTAEKSLFKLVMGVSGIGPTTALHIVAAGSDAVVDAVQQAEVSFFTAVPRVGKKLAQKIIIDLGSKVGELKKLNLGPTSDSFRDFSDALLGLGFSERDVASVAEKINLENEPIESAVKKALKELHAQKKS